MLEKCDTLKLFLFLISLHLERCKRDIPFKANKMMHTENNNNDITKQKGETGLYIWSHMYNMENDNKWW